MNEFYIHLEVQVNSEGIKSVIPMVYDDYSDSEAKYHDVASAACKSGLPYHASIVLDSTSRMLYSIVKTHAVESEEE